MGFEFIDNSTINGGSRRLIRSHVMKGKNAGRSLKHARKPRDRAKEADAATRIAPLRLVDNVLNDIRQGQAAKDLDRTALAVRDWAWNGFLYFTFPLELTPQVTYLLHSLFAGVGDALYPPEFCQQIDIMKSLWLNYMLEDEAVFHSMLAITAAMIDFFLARQETSPVVLRHLSQTFKLVNERLSSNEALSDTTLGVVVLLVIYEQLRRDENKRQVHFEGLLRMVQLRGGLVELKHNCSLVQKICRADIEAALQDGTTTHFSWDDIPQETLASLLPAWLSQAGNPSKHFEKLPAELQHIIMEITHISDCLNNNQFNPTLAPFTYQAALLSFWYRLLPYKPLNSPDSGDLIENAVHLGVVAFLTTTLLQFGRRKILPYRFISRKMMDTLRVLVDTNIADKALNVWLLFIGGISVLDKVDQDWTATHIKRITGDLGIRDWPSVRGMLAEFPWINTLHDESAHALWDSVPEDIKLI